MKMLFFRHVLVYYIHEIIILQPCPILHSCDHSSSIMAYLYNIHEIVILQPCSIYYIHIQGPHLKKNNDNIVPINKHLKPE